MHYNVWQTEIKYIIIFFFLNVNVCVYMYLCDDVAEAEMIFLLVSFAWA